MKTNLVKAQSGQVRLYKHTLEARKQPYARSRVADEILWKKVGLIKRNIATLAEVSQSEK